MKIELTAAILLVALCCFTGCGSLHVFDETHTHIEKRAVIDTDDATVSILVYWINKMKKMSEPVEEPLTNFQWDEKILIKYEGDNEDE